MGVLIGFLLTPTTLLHLARAFASNVTNIAQITFSVTLHTTACEDDNFGEENRPMKSRKNDWKQKLIAQCHILKKLATCIPSTICIVND